MLQTISELSAASRAKLDLAAKYEALIGKRVFLKRTVENLEKAAVDVTPLQKIYDLIPEVPPTILTRGSSSLGVAIPEFMEVRGLLIQVVSGALGRATDQEAARAANLIKAQVALAAVEAEISELERTA
jgi:hypothetical protein